MDLIKYQHLHDEYKFDVMLDDLYAPLKRVTICNDFYYSSNSKNETITSQVGVNRIKLTRYNLLWLKKLQPCIDLYILKKQCELYTSHVLILYTRY